MKRKVLFAVITLIPIAFLFGILFYRGVIHLNNPSKSKYPVRGVDVSHHQGEIDWKTIAEQDIRFAFIKATEGSSHKDDQFDRNWQEAGKAGLRVGAYHFFSLDSAGVSQAENFCKAVESCDGMLPPVVDVEPYGKYREPDALDKERLFSELGDFLELVETHFALKPIIYTTEEWLPVLREAYGDYDVWIRSVYNQPASSVKWTFWQYSNRHVLDGYRGTERYIDMNVFCGSEADFYDYPGDSDG